VVDGDEMGVEATPPLDDEGQPAIPIDQLKQMLSSQLEYYFSRYVL